MHTLASLKKLHLDARKARDEIKAKVLGTLIGDLETCQKNGALTDDKIMAFIKKFLKDTDYFIGVCTDEDKRKELEKEHDFLQDLLPRPTSEKDLKAAIAHYLEENPTANMGSVMSYLRGRFQGNYDGKLASSLAAAATKAK